MPFLAIFGFLKNIPWQLWAIAALVAAHFWLQHEAVAANDAKWEARIAAQKAIYAKQVAALEQKQQEVITRTVTEYRDRVKIVKEKGDAIIKEIPVLVHDTCVLSGGVRVAHDAAAAGHMPDDPAGAAGAAAAVEVPALVFTVGENYAACRSEYEKLIALQTLVSGLQGNDAPKGSP